MIKKRIYWVLSSFFLCLVITGCTIGVINTSSPVPVYLNSKMAVIPFSNYTETPLAGERAMSITAAVLETRGLSNLAVYQNQGSANNNVLLPGMSQTKSRQALLQWARSTGARYAMTGSVNEWTYKVGLDGEPVVGLSLQLIELSSKHIVWTSVGGVSGGSRIAVSTVAQKLINALLDGLLKSTRSHP